MNELYGRISRVIDHTESLILQQQSDFRRLENYNVFGEDCPVYIAKKLIISRFIFCIEQKSSRIGFR